jgi:hypothetical protein
MLISSYLFIFMKPDVLYVGLIFVLIGALGRSVSSNVMFWFTQEDGVGGSCARKKTGFSHPNNQPVPASNAQHSSPATDSQQHNPTR